MEVNGYFCNLINLDLVYPVLLLPRPQPPTMRNLTRRISQQETSCFAMGGFAVLFKALLSPERSSVTEIPQAVSANGCLAYIGSRHI